MAALTGSFLLILGFSFLSHHWKLADGLLHPDGVTGVLCLLLGAGILWLGLWPRGAGSSSRRRRQLPSISYADKLLAAQQQRVIRLSYEDRAGNVTQRDIEVYRPRDDGYVYAYCRLRQEPRTFLVENILRWDILKDRFIYNPLVDEWFETEGKKFGLERDDWLAWVAHKQQSGADIRGGSSKKKNLWDQ